MVYSLARFSRCPFRTLSGSHLRVEIPFQTWEPVAEI
jgi:hypothetical protein